MLESDLMLKISRDTLLVDELAAMPRNARYNRMGVIAHEAGLEFSDYMKAAVDGCCDAWLTAKELRDCETQFAERATAYSSTMRDRINRMLQCDSASLVSPQWLADRIAQIVEIAWMAGAIDGRVQTIESFKKAVMND